MVRWYTLMMATGCIEAYTPSPLVDADSDADTDTAPGELDVTIYDVQSTLGEDLDVVLTDVIVTGIGPFGVFVQEVGGGPYSGVYVFLGGSWTSVYPGIGVYDRVDVRGVTNEYLAGSSSGSQTQLSASNSPGALTRRGAGSEPTPANLSLATLQDPSAAEPWEGGMFGS